VNEVLVGRPSGDPTAVGNGAPMALMLGPCVIESREHALRTADFLAAMGQRLSIPIIYKSSFDKANRTSGTSYRGPGLAAALPIFEAIRRETGLPVTTDIHEPAQCAVAAEVVDLLQIPAFLCRQTDLLEAAAATGRPVNVKKGQFLAPWDMKHVAAKLDSAGASGVMLTERGTSFGYNTLVVDMRSLAVMAEIGKPVVFDATHSVQQPGGRGGSSGGQREFVPVLARAAVAIGIDALFLETHEDPDLAPSDGSNMIPLSALEPLLVELQALDQIAKSRAVR
jgi:2-dehydro-3-deoxyphosphooctonate aldolase (KDO 8-P synthase)